MGDVIKADFESEGFKIADLRAKALHEWMAQRDGPVTVDEIKKEMVRLQRIMPAPED